MNNFLKSLIVACAFAGWFTPAGANDSLPPDKQNFLNKTKECKRYYRAENKKRTKSEADRVMLAKSETCQSACRTAYGYKHQRTSQASADWCLRAYNAFKSPGEQMSVDEMLAEMDAMGAEAEKFRAAHPAKGSAFRKRRNLCLFNANKIREESSDLAQATRLWGACAGGHMHITGKH